MKAYPQADSPVTPGWTIIPGFRRLMPRLLGLSCAFRRCRSLAQEGGPGAGGRGPGGGLQMLFGLHQKELKVTRHISEVRKPRVGASRLLVSTSALGRLGQWGRLWCWGSGFTAPNESPNPKPFRKL